MRLIDQRIGEISDAGIEKLILELEHTARVGRLTGSTLYTYLVQCLASWDGSKRQKLDKNRVIPGGLLSRRLGKLQIAEPSIYRVCDELARISNQTAELGENMALYVFLNKYVPDLFKRKKSPPHDPRDWI